MRAAFLNLLHDHMAANPRIWLLTSDLGFGVMDRIMADFPRRAINVGAAEQLMLGAAVGLADEGMIPVCYTITPFYWRAAEWIRTYLNHERAPVKLVGAGRGTDYSAGNGFSHDASDDRDLFRSFPNVACFWPEDGDLVDTVTTALYHPAPTYINLKR